ncbi:EscU/YscU/HrcU family type III secretion system export apparatus switch protein [Paraglaciecola arctica]|uniref:Flagellar biosynthetic protein FlhB n=1 Tax=Paraglaciecola arctica BSs20135 TaxID=493475 RepID=K6Z3X1_9ALTE|nr:EscU/YscU/HrcU family type III secretion system export apparatus switch protein [Paraglaciecola arctica]GAC18130.1 flagellar biosynthesis protein [Paraglaciecola arctica BSs20135]
MTDKTPKKPKQKSAVGLKYNQSNQNIPPTDGASSGGAPTIIAKGFGDLAEEIIALARQNGVLVHEDPYLSDFLATLDLGQEIPDQLYHVIAELISFSYVLQGKFPDSWAKTHNKISKKV